MSAKQREMMWKGSDELREHLVPLNELANFPGNIDREHAAKIGESLLRWGQVRPVLIVDDVDGKTTEGKTIVAGHHVVKAARLLGWTHIAAIPGEFKDWKEAEMYVHADNKLGLIGWQGVDPDQMMIGQDLDEEQLRGTGLTLEELQDRRAIQVNATETVELGSLHRHFNAPRSTTNEQMEHLVQSLREHGLYRNIVVANDGTILAGHAIAAAAARVGLKRVPVTRMPYAPDDPRALKILAGDNEMQKLASLDDRQLTELLLKIKDDPSALVGTGYDPATLANLLTVTRSAKEVKDQTEALEWVGLTPHESSQIPYKVIVQCETIEDRDRLMELIGMKSVIGRVKGRVVSCWYPDHEPQDLKQLRFVEIDDEDDLLVEEQA